MKPDDDQSQQYLKRLDELLDRMGKAGFIKQHAHMQSVGAMHFSPKGLAFVQSVKAVDSAIGPLDHGDILCLWLFCKLTEITGPLP